MGRGTYAAVLLFVVLGSGWLEYALRTRVLRRWRRWLLALLAPATAYVLWDLLAVRAGHWGFNPDRVLGRPVPGGLPVEELLFFVVVPTAALLTLEAVRSVTGWTAGDEAQP